MTKAKPKSVKTAVRVSPSAKSRPPVAAKRGMVGTRKTKLPGTKGDLINTRTMSEHDADVPSIEDDGSKDGLPVAKNSTVDEDEEYPFG